MRIQSEIDGRYTLLMGCTALILCVSVFFVSGWESYLLLLIVIPIVCFLSWIYFGTYYMLCDTYLYCRSGPFVEKINYESIKSIKLCQNLYSSMALSSKRIEIKQHGKGYFTGTTYISPIQRERFLHELSKQCTRLEQN